MGSINVQYESPNPFTSIPFQYLKLKAILSYQIAANSAHYTELCFVKGKLGSQFYHSHLVGTTFESVIIYLQVETRLYHGKDTGLGRSVSHSLVFCLPCIVTNTSIMKNRVPVLGTKYMKMTWTKHHSLFPSEVG